MHIIKYLYNTVLEALFPISEAEREVLRILSENLFVMLPRAKTSPIPEACGIFSYKDERIRKLIWCIKYKKSNRGATLAGYALHKILADYSKIVPQLFIIPMPITSRRRRERGFNQCELIADAIARLDVEHHLRIVRDVLFRKQHKSRQTMKDRVGRLESAHDIFTLDESGVERLKSKLDMSRYYLIIVIDDVITTGSTILDAVKTLRKAGFEKTFGMTVAH